MFRRLSRRASGIAVSFALATLAAGCDTLPSEPQGAEEAELAGPVNVYLQATDENGNTSIKEVSASKADVDKMLAARRDVARPASAPTAKRLQMVGISTSDWTTQCQSWEYAILTLEDGSFYCITAVGGTWTPRYLQMPGGHYVTNVWAGNTDVAICTSDYSGGCWRNGVLLGSAVVDVVPAYAQEDIYNSAATWASNYYHFDLIR